MIVVIEAACKGFSHEAFNAGTISQLHRAFPGEPIRYIAEKAQTSCVSLILEDEHCNSYEYEAINNDDEFDSKCKKVISETLQTESITLVVVCGYPLDAGPFFEEISSKYTLVKFAFVQHGQIEHLLPPVEWKAANYWYRSKRDAVRKKLYYESIKHDVQYREHIIRLLKNPNCRLVGFSKALLETNLAAFEFIKNSLTVIHLPYVFMPLTDRQPNNTIRIGLMPSSVDDNYDNCERIIRGVYKEYRSRKINRGYQFQILNYGVPFWLKTKRVTIYSKATPSRSDIYTYLDGLDYLLIPYGENKYRLSSSGVLFDAISRDLPIIMFASKCFDEYESCGIGIRAHTIDDIVKIIVDEIESCDGTKYKHYVDNIEALKDRMIDENVRAFRSMLDV